MKKLVLLVMFFALISKSYSLSFDDKLISKGQKLTEEYAKAEGWSHELLNLVNDAVRTDGWQLFFSGTPNNTSVFAFKPEREEDIARILKKFRQIKDAGKFIILSPEKEAFVMGYTTALPKGNGISVSLHVSNQKKLSFWYKNLPEPKPGVRKYGSTLYEKEPEVSGPFLTVYLGNKLTDLEKLSFPENVKVISGMTEKYQRENSESPLVRKIKELSSEKEDEK